MNIDSAYEQFYEPVYGYALKLCRDEYLAQNVVADAFSGLFENMERVGDIRAYLYRTAYHNIVNDYRNNRRLAPDELALDIRDDDNYRPVEAYVENSERRELAQEVFCIMQSQLTPNERRVLVLRFLDGKNIEETEESTGFTKINVRVIQIRALQKLRKELGIEVTNKRGGDLCYYPLCKEKRARDSYCRKHANAMQRVHRSKYYEKKRIERELA